MKITKNAFRIGPVIIIYLSVIGLIQIANTAHAEDYCFTCHTNPRKLIEITRELAKSNLNKLGASVETRGEG